MKKRIALASITLLLASGIVLYKTNPMLLKVVIGQASIIGKPIIAKVYTDNILNDSIKVFSVVDNNAHEKYWLLDLTYASTAKAREIIWIDNIEKKVGTPVGSNSMDYKYWNNRLLQSEVGGKYVAYNSIKYGYDFDMQLKISASEITFKLPPTEATKCKFDSIRIEL